MNEDRLEELLDRYVDERLTPAEKAELESLLLRSPAARDAFWARLRFEGMLEEAVDARHATEWIASTDGSASPASPPSPSSATQPRGLWARWTRFMSDNPVVTALGAAAVVVLAFLANRSTDPAPIVEPTSNGIAVLTSAWNVRWSEAQTPLLGGSVLPPSRIRIGGGVLGIEFYSGARLTLEGPADIELVRVDEVLCHSGKMRVQVPHVARHFRVRTEQLDVLDLGTEFALDASADAATEVHVFDGKVAWAGRNAPSAATPKEELLAGQAIRLNPGGVSRIAARPEEFVSGGLLAQRVLEQQQSRLRTWADASRRIGDDPRTLLHFDFAKDPAAPRTVRNRAGRTGTALDGIVVGSEWTEGRWRDKGAMEFKHPSDRVRVVVPGEFDALTYVAWLRVKTVERMFTSIFLTDGFEPGEPHWQFFEGKIRLGIGDAERRKPTRYLNPRVWLGPSGANYTTDESLPAFMLDRWVHLAVVMDATRREVTHYIDGESVCSEAMVIAQKLRIGDAELGNWGLPATTDPQPVRNFQGTMDEFTIFSAALDPQEIAQLFEEGRPLPAPVHLAQSR